jgi:Tol biopolymer transport system component
VIGAAVLALAVAGCSGGGQSHVAVAVPAEQHLVYIYGQDPSQASVWIADVNGSHGRRLGAGSVAVLTPDGKTVAVRRSDGIYLLSTSGKELRKLTSRRLRPQAWSPDGKTLIATRAGQLAVLELDATGSTSRRRATRWSTRVRRRSQARGSAAMCSTSTSQNSPEGRRAA